MKKSALLAVSALSLGVVGLASFAPMASAVDAQVKVNIQGDIGVGGGDAGAAALVVDFGSIAAGAKAGDKTVNAVVNNNTGNTATLTLSAAETDLKSGDNRIPTGTNIAAGTAAWGVKANGAEDYAALTADGVAVRNDIGQGNTSIPFTYGLSAAANTIAGDYTGNVTYTVSATPANSGNKS